MLEMQISGQAQHFVNLGVPKKKKKNSNKASKVSCQMANAWWPLTIHRYTYLQVLCLHVSEKNCRLFASTICGVVAGFMSTCFLL